MHPLRKRRLFMILAFLGLLSLVMALVLYALRQNISLFYTPSQVVSGEAPKSTLLRVGGMVMKGGIDRGSDGQTVVFSVTDYQSDIKIHYHGILPDLFREGQGVVVRGRVLDSGEISAEEVLAKHDAKYMPPEIRDFKKTA